VSSHGQPHALVHQARRTIRNRQDGNPFATDEVIADLIEALGSAYLAAPNGTTWHGH
jgi:hypothetical protein